MGACSSGTRDIILTENGFVNPFFQIFWVDCKRLIVNGGFEAEVSTMMNTENPDIQGAPEYCCQASEEGYEYANELYCAADVIALLLIGAAPQQDVLRNFYLHNQAAYTAL